MPVDVKLKGFKELEEALHELSLPTQKKVMRKALRKGAEPVYTQMKADIDTRWGEQSGVLHKSVQMRTNFPTKRKSIADGYVNIGVFRIRSIEPIGDAYYGRTYIGAANLAWWFERGISAHALGKRSKVSRGKDTGGGMHPGMPAKPVMRQVFDTNKSKMVDGVKDVLGQEIDKIWRKNNKRG